MDVQIRKERREFEGTISNDRDIGMVQKDGAVVHRRKENPQLSPEKKNER